MQANLYYASLLAAVLLVLIASGPSTFATITESTQSPQTTDQSEESEAGITTVAVGEGSNGTFQNYTFTPQTVEINAGDSVTWYSPVDPGVLVDIHTVTFKEPSVTTDLILPFAVRSDTTEFPLLPPFNAGEPTFIQAPDGRQAIVAINKLAFYPAILDANNQTTFLNGTDIEYTTDGTERLVNSGIILPAMPTEAGPEPNSTETGTTGGEQIGPPFPPVSSFTVTFQEPGTYPYYCAIHPWMSGQVIVRGEAETETLGQNQTETLGQNDVVAPNPIFE